MLKIQKNNNKKNRTANLTFKISEEECSIISDMSRYYRIKFTPLVRQLIFKHIKDCEEITFFKPDSLLNNYKQVNFAASNEEYQIIEEYSFKFNTTKNDFLRCMLQQALKGDD